MQQPNTDGPINKRWEQVALQYFHDVPARATKNVCHAKMTADAEGITVEIGSQDYWIPQPHASEVPERKTRD